MFTDEKPGRRFVGSLFLGVGVALASFALDAFFDRRDGTLATNALNDSIIGAAAAFIAHIWVSRRDARHAQQLVTERLMQETIHKERKRIALEIHDTVGQAHAGAIMYLELASESLGTSQVARDHVRRALRLVCGSMTEMRCALWDLYPEELQKLDLASAIECLVKDLTSGDGLIVHFSADGSVRRLPLEVEKALLRICQEALSNAVKHAQAHEVRINLLFNSREARLTIKDDGQGFLPEEQSEGFGLISMQDRARSLGGVWTIRSELGSGTDVHVSIPIPPMMD
ncbi:MAG: sensor histidine kinase [Terracidiphilus sp.]